MEEKTIGAVAELAKQAAAQLITGADGRQYVVTSKECTLAELPGAYQDAPPYIRQGLMLTTKDSFCDYVQAFEQEETRIFADINHGRFVAVMDYHHGPGNARPAVHRATFQLQTSEEWKRWSEISGKLQEQALFLRYLEENAADVEEPTGADLLEIVQDFHAHRKVQFTSSKRLQSGAEAFEYTEEIRGSSKTGEIEVPNKFRLRIPIYYGEPTAELFAFLRFRLDPFGLGIELHRPDYVRQACFEAIGRDIAERTGRPLHFGALGSS